MSEAAIAKRYAKAIFELGSEENQLDTLTKQLGAMADVYRNHRELRGVMENPLVPANEREGLLVAVAERLGVSGLAMNTLRLLQQRRRLMLLPEIARMLRQLADERQGVVRATVTSAAPLGAGYLANLQKELEALTHCRVLIDHQQDPLLVAGLVTRIGDKTIDGSIQGRLAELERQLLQA